MWKIDLEKAYDSLSWEFISRVLKETSIDERWVNLIIECVKVEKMQLVWNGELNRSFSPGQGIRQGDPLSPYLFVLCIVKLSYII